MSLLDKYLAFVAKKDIKDDAAQRRIIAFLDEVLLKVNKYQQWYWQFLPIKLKGLYLSGPVGAGKTYLMDLFYENVLTKKKSRFHFHHFMQQIDKKLREVQGKSNPLEFVVKQFAKQTRVLCLDEFLVKDVAHAMMLAQLLHALFKRGVVLVVTSNTEVDLLYKDGVGRDRFLPAILQIKKHCLLATIHSKTDYRFQRGAELKTYFFPLNPQNTELFLQEFTKIVPKATESGALLVLSRPIKYLKSGNTCIWFDFFEICNVPRCQLDYLELANKFDTVFISGVPTLSENSTIQALLFMHFVDVAYDRGMRLFLLSAVSLDNLYISGGLGTEFSRTLSRLREMQSSDYLTRHAYITTTAQII